MTASPELFRHFPALRSHLPWTALARPTPVQGMAANQGRVRIWVKRDDRTSDVFGGHQARGLEFLLGAAMRRGARRLLAFGRAGSQSCLALTAFACRQDLDVILALWGRARSRESRQTLQRAHELGAALYRLDGSPLALYRLGRRSMGAPRGIGRQLPFVVWPRQARLLAALGNVNGVFELQRQIRCGILPEPESMYVRSQAPELLAGLLLGCELAGLGTRIVAEATPGQRRQAYRLAQRGLGFLRRHVQGLHVQGLSPTRLACVGATAAADHRLRALLLNEESLMFPELPLPAPPLTAALAEVLGPEAGPTLVWHAAAPPPQPVSPPLLPRALREFVVPS